MATRPIVPQYRPGQVPPGGLYTPIQWPATNARYQTMQMYIPVIDTKQWLTHRLVCMDLVMRTENISEKRDRVLLYTLHRMFTWAALKGYSTAPEALLSGDRIDSFVQAAWAKPASRAAHRSRLRAIAATVFPAPVQMKIPRTATAAPHTGDDVARFLQAAKSLIRGHKGTLPKRQEMYRDVCVILALSLGAGTNGRELHQVKESWLRRESDGWWLYRKRSFPTPITDSWMALIEPHLTGTSENFLLRPLHVGERNQQVGKVMSKARLVARALEDFDADRASRYWHLRLLRAIEFPLAAAVAGYKDYGVVPGDMLPACPIIDTPEARAMVRRWLS